MGESIGQAGGARGMHIDFSKFTDKSADLMYALNAFSAGEGKDIEICLGKLKDCNVTGNPNLAKQAMDTLSTLFDGSSGETKQQIALLGLVLDREIPLDFPIKQREQIREKFKNAGVDKKILEGTIHKAGRIFGDEKKILQESTVNRLFHSALKLIHFAPKDVRPLSTRAKETHTEPGSIRKSASSAFKHIGELAGKLKVKQKESDKAPAPSAQGRASIEAAIPKRQAEALSNDFFLHMLDEFLSDKSKRFVFRDNLLHLEARPLKGALPTLIGLKDEVTVHQVLEQMKTTALTGSIPEKQLLLTRWSDLQTGKKNSWFNVILKKNEDLKSRFQQLPDLIFRSVEGLFVKEKFEVLPLIERKNLIVLLLNLTETCSNPTRVLSAMDSLQKNCEAAFFEAFSS